MLADVYRVRGILLAKLGKTEHVPGREASREDAYASALLAELVQGREYMEENAGASWQDYMERLMRERAEKMREEGFPTGGTEKTVQDVRIAAFVARGARCSAILDMLEQENEEQNHREA